MTIKIGANKSNFPTLFRPEKTTFLFHFPNFPWFARGTSSNNYSIHLPEVFGDIIGIPTASHGFPWLPMASHGFQGPGDGGLFLRDGLQLLPAAGLDHLGSRDGQDGRPAALQLRPGAVAD